MSLPEVSFAAAQASTARSPDENICFMFQMDGWNLAQNPHRDRVFRYETGYSVRHLGSLRRRDDTQNSSVCDIYFGHINAVESVRPMGENVVFIDAGTSNRTMKKEPVGISPGGQMYVSICGMGIFRGKQSPRRKPIQVPLRPPQISHDLESNPGLRDGKTASILLSYCMAF
jgi:hypothetical protein